MSKPKKIDLNKYTRVLSEEDLTGYHSIIIVPAKTSDGTQLPSLYFRGNQEQNIISDITGVVWDKEARISILGTQEEYNDRVNWWFNEADKNSNYRDFVNQTYSRMGFHVRDSWEKGRIWLLSQEGNDRKSYIHKFIWNWMQKGYQWHMNRIKKNVFKND